ncbi:MAG: hypothetical protein JO126_03540 [Alphaproteobacteria bacterium]|nr:hypothetical protein [Alphaproteobacteria bacterium]MBV8548511.1 hypothetical protein [Alphaproteobacteria bacterium]
MTIQPPNLDDEAFKKQRAARNRAIFAFLLAVVVLIYAITMVKIKVTGTP